MLRATFLIASVLLVLMSSNLARATSTAQTVVATVGTDDYGPLTTVPEPIIGGWKQVGERCEESEERSYRHVNVVIRFGADFHYELSVEGWTSRGTYRVDRFSDSPLRIQLVDTLYTFNLVGSRLENWGEGDAAFLCGRIFEREEEVRE